MINTSCITLLFQLEHILMLLTNVSECFFVFFKMKIDNCIDYVLWIKICLVMADSRLHVSRCIKRER